MDKVKAMLERISLDKIPERRIGSLDGLSEKHRKTLGIVAARLNSVPGLDWALIGSANLVLQGVERSANDIDVYVDAESFERILDLDLFEGAELKRGIDRKVFVADVLGFVVEGVDVEIVGPMKREDGGDLWTKKGDVFDFVIALDLGEFEVMAVPLEMEFGAYALNGREEKVVEMLDAVEKVLLG